MVGIILENSSRLFCSRGLPPAPGRDYDELTRAGVRDIMRVECDDRSDLNQTQAPQDIECSRVRVRDLARICVVHPVEEGQSYA